METSRSAPTLNFRSIVQVTLNTGRIRITVPTDSAAAEIDAIAGALRAGLRPPTPMDGFLSIQGSPGSARILISAGADGLRIYSTAVLTWDAVRAPALWTAALANASARSGPVPMRTMPIQLPWLAAHVTPEARSQPREFIVRLGEVTRAAAWAVLQQCGAAQ